MLKYNSKIQDRFKMTIVYVCEETYYPKRDSKDKI